MKVAVPSAQHSPMVRAARFLADGVERLVAQDVLRVRVRRAGADPDLQPLRPSPARAGVLRDRIAGSEEAAIGLRAARVHHLGRRAVPAHRVRDNVQLAEGAEVGSRCLEGHAESLAKGRTMRRWSTSPTRSRRAFARRGPPERAESEKRYLKSDLTFLGATVWQIRAAVTRADAADSTTTSSSRWSRSSGRSRSSSGGWRRRSCSSAGRIGCPRRTSR